MLPIYWINLERSVKRRQQMYNHFLKQKIVNRRIPGVINDTPHIGCLLAHLKAIRQAWLDGCELALICEDDADLSDFARIFDRINEILMTLPEKVEDDWDIIQIQYTGPPFLEELATQVVRIPNTIIKGYMMGAVAYMINRRGMEKFLKTMTDQDTLDIIRYSRKFNLLSLARAEEFIYRYVNTYFSLYPVVNYTVEPSTIDPTPNYYVPIQENFDATGKILQVLKDKKYAIHHYHEMEDHIHWIDSKESAIKQLGCLLPSLTVLGDIIKGWDSSLEDNQLLRCSDHKKYEAKLLLALPEKSSFLDIGSHYGDTVITMALHARSNGREDIRFFAFEPSKKKSEYIQRMSRINDLDITVFNRCVGDKKGCATAQEDEQYGSCSYKETEDGASKVITINSIKTLVSPVGIMHVDVEGWESKVLKGASEILKTPGLFVIAECWEAETSKHRGFSESPEKDISLAMQEHAGPHERQPDLHDEEKNLVYKITSEDELDQ